MSSAKQKNLCFEKELTLQPLPNSITDKKDGTGNVDHDQVQSDQLHSDKSRTRKIAAKAEASIGFRV